MTSTPAGYSTQGSAVSRILRRGPCHLPAEGIHGSLQGNRYGTAGLTADVPVQLQHPEDGNGAGWTITRWRAAKGGTFTEQHPPDRLGQSA